MTLAVEDTLLSLSHGDTAGGESFAHLFESLGVCVVFLTDVAEEYILEVVGDMLSEKSGCVAIVEVSALGADTSLEIFGIRTICEHMIVVVGFDHQVVGLTHIVSGAVGDGSDVGGEHKSAGVEFDGESHIVAAVVRHIEGRDLKIGHLKGYLLEDRYMILFDASGDGVSAQDTVEHTGCAVEFEMTIVAQEIVGILDMIGVVVCEKYTSDFVHSDAVGDEHLLHLIISYSGVDEYPALASAEVGAIAARAASDRHVVEQAFRPYGHTFVTPCHRGGCEGWSVGSVKLYGELSDIIAVADVGAIISLKVFASQCL